MKKRTSKPSKKRGKNSDRGQYKPRDAVAGLGLRTQIESLLRLYSNGSFDDAEALAVELSTTHPAEPIAWKVLTAIYAQTGRLSESLQAGRTLVELVPNDAEAHNNFGGALQRAGRLEEALESFKKAAIIDPKLATAHFNVGTVLMGLEQFSDAEVSLRQALALQPTFVESYVHCGLVLKALDRFSDAEVYLRKGLALRQDDPEIMGNLGVVLHAAGKLDEAERLLLRAISLDENSAELRVNLGAVLAESGRLEAALASHKVAIALRPNFAAAYSNLGDTQRRLGRWIEAEASHRVAIQIDPHFAYAHSNLADVLKDQGKLEEAEASCRRAVSLSPGEGLFHVRLGAILQLNKERTEAILSYQRSLDLGLSDADAPEVQSLLFHQRQQICDFSVFDVLSATAPKLGVSTARVPPFAALTWSDDPEQHLLRAQVYARETFKQPAQTPPVKPMERPARLKIGYFSADFHNFPGMYLMAGLLESHDRERFEVYAFSYGPDKDDAMRRRIVAAVDHFIDIREMSTQEAVDLSREHGIDIALHRNGHTKGSRTELFQHRLAPVQISYLGYPGTLGADFIDYLVADPVVIPEEERQYYSEKIIYLPDTYQPNDNTRQIAETNTTRADFGLPAEGFVLCCFNQNYKISPREFDIWMRVLGQVEGSVLWLLKSNRWAEENLKKEAEHRGIDPSRVIFAERIPHAEHLARHKHADLFVDTFNYNAHTTASDALWSGLPIVTKQGRQFAARVAASLLSAVGLPELITESEEDYERLILELASNPERLSAIRETLSNNRHTEPLFDTQQYARHLEGGLCRVFDAYFDNSELEDVRV